MNITKTIITATVTLVTLEVNDGKTERRTSTIKLYSCYALSDAKITKAVREIDPKAVIVSVEKRKDKYAIDIKEFVKMAHVEQ